jgi:hypothetical protein
MNKRGNLFAAAMVALILFMVGMLVTNFFMPEVTQARTDLSCASAGSISDGTKIMCIMVDSTVIYWIILVCSIAGGVIFEKLTI